MVPKAGSATIRHSLSNYTDIGYPVSQFEQHVTIRKFLKIDGAKKLFNQYFKFTFVRNPYDRLYSGYLQDRKASITWQKWIVAKKPIFDKLGNDFNRYITQYVAKANLKDQWDWICFCPMTEFSHVKGKYALDWYGKTEYLARDLKKLGEKLDIDIEKAGDRNVITQPGRELKYLKYYNRRAIEVVNSIYSKDFDFFGYKKLDPADFPESM